MYFQTSEVLLARQSVSWPQTPGILAVEIDEYRKELSYHYVVNGVSYTSDRVIFGE